jgi:hypothetical protein
MTQPGRLHVEPEQRFGRLVVLCETRLPGNHGSGYRAAVCLCKCGKVKTVRLEKLRSGQTRSCGCLARETAAELCRTVKPHTKHGQSSNRNPLYYLWTGMMTRCYTETSEAYHHYGGRGIIVCPEWHDVANFITWIEENLGPRPEGMSLDRIDNDGPYAPGNVRWRDQSGQCVNRRPNVAGSSKYKGVFWSTYHGRWIAQIKTKGHGRRLGSFKNEEDAARAYDAAALNLWGADAWLNAEHFTLEGTNA